MSLLALNQFFLIFLDSLKKFYKPRYIVAFSTFKIRIEKCLQKKTRPVMSNKMRNTISFFFSEC